MNRPVRVPVNLGCCPTEARCLLCAPAPKSPDPETLRALADTYRDRAGESPLTYTFFGGPPPSDALLDVVDGPFTVRVRPDLLSRAEVDRLVDRGCVGIELDALTFDDELLKACGRIYRAARLKVMAEAIEARGLRVGITLAPGLPGGSFERSLRDAVIASDLADTARIHPVLVLAGSKLAERHRLDFYRPLGLADAVTVARAMVDVLEASGVEVIRVGQQAGPDHLGRVLAGPEHSSFRELVEARRTLDRLRGLLDGTPTGAIVEIHCAPADETRTRGPLNQHVRTLRAEFGFSELSVVPDPELFRGALEISASFDKESM